MSHIGGYKDGTSRQTAGGLCYEERKATSHTKKKNRNMSYLFSTNRTGKLAKTGRSVFSCDLCFNALSPSTASSLASTGNNTLFPPSSSSLSPPVIILYIFLFPIMPFVLLSVSFSRSNFPFVALKSRKLTKSQTNLIC